MSSNDIVWCMKYCGKYHVFYAGCADNTPEIPEKCNNTKNIHNKSRNTPQMRPFSLWREQFLICMLIHFCN